MISKIKKKPKIIPQLSSGGIMGCIVWVSVCDPHQCRYADPDPAFLTNADLDPDLIPGQDLNPGFKLANHFQR
jgi:hypothetical protein